ncbi:MAG: PAS domain S-box protein, partial [Planctomycetes bacterium]|nr:PAS domain S-box protein [Planctomycetota bacterium]
MTEKPTYEELEKRIQELEQVEYKFKRAEAALQESEGRYRAVVEDMPELICSFHPGGEITFVNKAYCEYFGESFEELVGTTFLSLIPESEQKAVMDNISALTVESPTQSHEHTVIAPNGVIRWQRWTNRALFDDQGKTVEYQSIGMDTTERKQVEEALRQERNRAQMLLDIAGVMFVAIDAKGQVILVNQKGSMVLGYEQKEIIGKNWFDNFLPVSIKDQTKTVFNRLMTGETEPIEYYENPVLTKSGEERIIAWHNAILKDNEGSIYGTLSSGEDITERKQAEEALRQSKERLQSIVNKAVVGIYQVTHEGKFLIVNHRLAQMFGFKSPEEFLTSVENISQLYVHPEERSSILEKIKARGFVDGIEIQFWNRDGQIVLTRVSVRVIRDKTKGTIYEGFMADITDHKREEKTLRESEEKLARSKKMESLGLLAGGVAHDLNNVLSGVVSYPDLLLMDLPQDSKLREPIKTIQESGHRAVAIVQDLLTVARGVAITKDPLNLNELVSDYLYSPEFKKLEQFHPTVTVKTDLDTNLLNINGSHVH